MVVPPLQFENETKNISYFVVKAYDSPEQQLYQHFELIHMFIEDAKLKGSAVLVHW